MVRTIRQLAASAGITALMLAGASTAQAAVAPAPDQLAGLYEGAVIVPAKPATQPTFVTSLPTGVTTWADVTAGQWQTIYQDYYNTLTQNSLLPVASLSDTIATADLNALAPGFDGVDYVAATTTAPASLTVSVYDSGTRLGVDGEQNLAYSIDSTGAFNATTGTTAVVEKDAVQDAAGLTFSKYSGVATRDATTGAVTVDIDGAPTAQTAVTADGVTVQGGGKTVTVASSGINNGGNVLSGVADGVANTDAVNLRQLNNLRNDLLVADAVLRDEIASSTATAIALGGAVILPDVNFSLSGNVGFYEGATAIAANAAYRVAPNMYLTGAFGGGLNKRGNIGGRVGFAVGF